MNESGPKAFSKKIDAGKPIVSMISNCLCEEYQKMGREINGYLTEGVINPLTFSYNDSYGIVPILDILPEEIFTVSGTKRAKDYFLKAVEYSVEEGVKVILLAASTKRLFGKGTELRSLFPNTTFTIGDNGTAFAFLKQIEYVTRDFPKDSPVVVIGMGFLGEAAIGFLNSQGFQKVIIISHHVIKKLPGNIQFQSLDEYIGSKSFEGASLILGCAHNHHVTASQINAMIRERLIIIDVAVPKAVSLSMISSLHHNIFRFDGGDFVIKNLKLHFPPQVIGLNSNTEFYGCFTEAFVLALSDYEGDSDFFNVTDHNMDTIKSLMEKYSTDIFVSMKNFGQPVSKYESVLTL